MKLRDIGVISIVLGGAFLAGWLFGRNYGINSVERVIVPPIEGISTPAVAEEVRPDTIYLPRTADATSKSAPELAPRLVPIYEVPEPEREEALLTAALDWNTKRTFAGTIDLGKKIGTFNYSFPVQYNKAGNMGYSFQPAPITRDRLRFVIGGELYTNKLYSYGVGVQYKRFGLNIRALSSEKKGSYAFGIGVALIF